MAVPSWAENRSSPTDRLARSFSVSGPLGRSETRGGQVPGYRRCKIWATSLAGGLGLVIGVARCSFGPKALERTHSQYNESIRRVYKEQLLQNLVRLR
jgi:hypothetical protein